MKRLLKWTTGLLPLLISSVALAQEHASSSGGDSTSIGVKSMLAIAAGFAIGIASFGGALGQSKAASSALEGISRNPEAASKVMTPMIIALALIESLVIYSLVIAFLLQGKI